MRHLHGIFHVCVLTMAYAPSVFSQQTAFTASLDGHWKSDWQLTKKHIEAECKLSDEAIAGLKHLMGKMTVQFDGKRAIFSMPEIRFTKDGKEHVLEA